MDSYNFISVFVLPLTLIHFSLDYLRDKDIKTNETKVGMLSYLHHFIVNFNLAGVLVLPFVDSTLSVITLNIIITIIAQYGLLINKERCWLTTKINNLINGKTNRKWIADLNSFIKHYIRGDKWAYSDINFLNNTNRLTFINTVFIIILIKFILKNK